MAFRFAESFVGSVLCGWGNSTGRCCMWAANGAEGRKWYARLAGNSIGEAGVEALVVALRQTARPTTLRFGDICVLVAAALLWLDRTGRGCLEEGIVPVDAGLGSRAPVGCCLSREGLAAAGRDWIVAKGAVALADASPQMTSLSLKGTVCFVFERLSDGLCGLAWSARPVGGGG